jgi:hypothetical protein
VSSRSTAGSGTRSDQRGAGVCTQGDALGSELGESWGCTQATPFGESSAESWGCTRRRTRFSARAALGVELSNASGTRSELGEEPGRRAGAEPGDALGRDRQRAGAALQATPGRELVCTRRHNR